MDQRSSTAFSAAIHVGRVISRTSRRGHAHRGVVHGLLIRPPGTHVKGTRRTSRRWVGALLGAGSLIVLFAPTACSSGADPGVPDLPPRGSSHDATPKKSGKGGDGNGGLGTGGGNGPGVGGADGAN